MKEQKRVLTMSAYAYCLTMYGLVYANFSKRRSDKPDDHTKDAQRWPKQHPNNMYKRTVSYLCWSQSQHILTLLELMPSVFCIAKRL